MRCFQIKPDRYTPGTGIIPKGSGYYKTKCHEVKIKIAATAVVPIYTTKNRIVVPLPKKIPLISCKPKCHQPIIQIGITVENSPVPSEEFDFGKNIVYSGVSLDFLFPLLTFDISHNEIGKDINISLNISINYLFDKCHRPFKPKKIVKDFVVEKTLWDFSPDNKNVAVFGLRLAEDPVGSGTTPGPLIEANLGDHITINLTNNLPEMGTDPDIDPTVSTGQSLHWHGVDLDNRSDGTPVTQYVIEPEGGKYKYDYIFPKPGIFWYHSHFSTLNQVFHGMSGPIIVRDCADYILTDAGILPSRREVITFSDVTVIDGIIPNMVNRRGDNAFGDIFLTNGKTEIIEYDVLSGEGIRLYLANNATFRFYNVSFNNPGGDNTIYRVGGNTGLLDNVRIEGGHLGKYDTMHEVGTILLPTADRADCVIIPKGNVGETSELLLSGLMLGISDASALPEPPKVVVRFNIVGKNQIEYTDKSRTNIEYKISEGDKLRTSDLVNDPVHSLKNATPDHLIDPDDIGRIGSDNPVITLDRNSESRTPAIDGVSGSFSTPEGPNIPTSRYYQVYDLIELSAQNTTAGTHSYHQHGEAMELVKIEKIDENGEVIELLYEYEWNEFVDIFSLPPFHRVTYRFRFVDRPKFDPSHDRPSHDRSKRDLGGGIGRWLFHCHQLLHSGRGMLSEMVVLPK